jgi:hypothetical protein
MRRLALCARDSAWTSGKLVSEPASMTWRARCVASIGLSWSLAGCGADSPPSAQTGGSSSNTGGAAHVAGANQSGSGGTPVAGGSAGSGGQLAGGGQPNAGTAGQGGSQAGGQAGAPSNEPKNEVFSQCRLHFGTVDAKAKEQPALISELDFFTPGWMGQSDTFDQGYVCDDVEPGAPFERLVPVVVAYVSAFYVKRHHGNLCDCNVSSCGETDGKPNDLCHFGAQYIKQDLAQIVEVYRDYGRGYADCLGTTRPIIFEMEPDWYQYTDDTQVSAMTREETADIMKQYVLAIKESLPNARFSMDISPWVDDNGATNGQAWYSLFDLSLFTFVNTSGGNTLGGSQKIRNDNLMTWAGVSGVTGKGILADTGYGAAGVSAGHDANWDSAENLNARLADGVIGISQYNPSGDWANTIKAVRDQLSTPKFCP